MPSLIVDVVEARKFTIFALVILELAPRQNDGGIHSEYEEVHINP